METSKRMLSFLLVVVMLFTMMPVPVQAIGSKPNTSIDTGNLTVEGTNGFGNLLSQEIQESQEESAPEMAVYGAGFSVIDLTFEGATATVEYSSLEEARLVVAVYSEDGLQLLASGETTVVPEEDIATVTIEGDMPEYFMASAYLMDTYDLSPLCAAYDTPMYTREMQELLDSTVDDYDPERVLILDEDETTNFAVYAEDTIVIEPADGVNTVTSVDDENATYVIKNADEQFTSLQEGDVFVYPYGENKMLIAKVGSVAVDGSTVTITGEELEMVEVFSHVKISDNGETEDFEFDDTGSSEGVTFVGVHSKRDDAIVSTAATSGTEEYKKYAKFTLDHTLDKTTPGVLEGEMKLTGTLNLAMGVSLEYYSVKSKQHVEVRLFAEAEVSVAIDMEVKLTLPLVPAKYSNLAVEIGFEPELIVEVGAEIAFTVTFVAEIVLTFGWDKFDIQSKGGYDGADLSIEGTLFIGIDLNPVVKVAKGYLADLDVEMPFGLEIKGTLGGSQYEIQGKNPDTRHDCEKCLDIGFSLVVEYKIKWQFLKSKWLKWEIGDEISWELQSMYLSLDKEVFGVGGCPYKSYRVVIGVKLADYLPGITVFKASNNGKQTELGVTDENGLLMVYLPEETYEFVAKVGNSYLKKTQNITNACKVLLDNSAINEGRIFHKGIIESEEIIDDNVVVVNGQCGDNLYWNLDNKGRLFISGTGPMWNYDYADAPWYSLRNSITSLWIGSHSGDEVTSIGDYAFSGCDIITSVEIGGDVATIGNYAFKGCTSLMNIEIPNSVSAIGNEAFYECPGLTKVTIGDGVATLNGFAFAHSYNLKNVTIGNSVTAIGNEAFYDCPSLNSVTIGNSVTTIGDYAFKDCISLSNVEIPDSVTAIGVEAFYGCSGLTSVTIGDGVSNLSGFSFASCNSLRRVTIGNSVTTIGNETFYLCPNLTSVIIGNGVTTIGNSAFQGCASLSNVKIPNSVTAIGNSAFQNCTSLSNVKIPDSVTVIGDSVYAGCGSLSGVKIPDSITAIANSAFSDCISLTNVEIPNSVTAIGDSAFQGCTSLANIEIPDSVTVIGNSAFHGCTSLTSVEIPDSVTFLGDDAFYECLGLTSVMLGNSVTTIGDGVFARCTSLNSIEIPSSVTAIGDSAFAACTSLTGIEIPDSVTAIGDGAFSSCDSLNRIEIPDSVTDLGNSVFSNCDSLISVSIGNSVTAIGECAFWYCGNLTSVEIPDSVVAIGEFAFMECNSLRSATIGNGVTTIGHCAFWGCDWLRSVEIPDSVTIIGDEAFWDNNSLKNVKIGDGVVVIGNKAFFSCDKLISVTIPNSVTTIGTSAFDDCLDLSEIIFCGDAPTIGSDAFDGIRITAYYPAGNTTWTSSMMQGYGGVITWVAYALDENGDIVTNETGAVTVVEELAETDVPVDHDDQIIPQASADILRWDFDKQEDALNPCEIFDSGYEEIVNVEEPLKPNSVFDGEYSTIVTETYTLKTASFSGLVPGEQYVLLAMVSIDVEDPLAVDNLLYIDQAPALEDGTLVFQYVQRTPTETSYVVACGASNKDLNDAEITFPEMVADGEIQVVNPTVVYGGKTLTEGQDYIIQGTVSVTDPGTYTCYIRGIRNYSGLVECTYAVISPYKEVAYGFCGDNMTWTFYDNGRLTISGNGPMMEFDGYSAVPWNDRRSSITTVIIEDGVTTIGNFAFAECTNLREVKLGESVTTIGNGAFRECTSLNAVKIPDSVTTIGGYVFQDCSSLSKVTIGNSLTEISTGAFGYCSSLESVTIGESVTAIRYGAFQSCTSLKNIMLPNSVVDIGNAAFKSCTNLASVTISEAVTNIGSSAFSGCKSLTNVEIPESVTSIGESAFAFCSNLTGIHVDESNPNYSCDDRGVLFDREKVELIQAPGAISGFYGIPDSVTTINDDAFGNCGSLTSVMIPDSVTAIGNGAFQYCRSLTSVKIPNSVTTISDYAFYECDGLKSVEIPDSVTAIGNSAFRDCGSLINVEMPDGIITIDNLVFASCTKLINITIPNGVTAIGDYAFSYCTGLKAVEIPESVKVIGQSVFRKCYNLEMVTIPDSVTTIGDDTFYECFRLSSITIPASVTTIGESAFYDCTNLGRITFAGDAPVVSEGAFSGVTATAYYPVGNPTWISDKLKNYGGNITWVIDCPNHSYETAVTEPTCTEYGFTTYTCTKCGYSYIADETEPIGHIYESVSTEDGKLIHTCIACGDSYTEVIPGALLYTVYEDYVEITGHMETPSELVIPTEIGGLPVKIIGDYAFANYTELTNVTIPDTVTSIGDEVFANCSNLETIRFIGDAPEFGDYVFWGVDGSVYYPGDNRTWTSEVMENIDVLNIRWVAEGEVFGMEIVSIPECGFVGREPDLSGLCVELIYGNDMHRQVDISALSISEIDTATAGKKIVTVGYGVFSVDFVYGVHDREPAVVLDPSLYPESEHNYMNNLDETQTLNWPGASSIVLVFSNETCLENYYDWLFVYDGEGKRIAYYTGNEASGVTLEVPGDTVEINLFTDYRNGRYGYSFDSITAMGAAIHIGDDSISIVDPTCTEPGRSVFICEICDQEQYTVIPELGHNFVDGICTRCSEVEPTEPEETAITITSQPADYVGMVGDTATFTVVAEGEGLKYQWYCSTDGGANWGTTGVTENTQSVVFLAYRNNQLYRCVITDAEGNTVTTDAAELKAKEVSLEITGQPQNYIGAVGDEAVFTLEANGNGLTYEWFVSSDGGATWAKSYMTGYMSETQTAVLRPYRDGYKLYCKVSDVFGNTVNSEVASMTVKSSEVKINSQPQSVENAAILQMYAFTVEAEGENLTYLWEVSTDGGATWVQSWSDGYNTDTLNIRMYQYRDGYQYRCVVTSGLKTVVITDVAELNLQAPSVAIESSPVSAYALLYEEVTMQVSATGTDLTYQWYYSTDGGTTWVENWMTGYNTDTLTFVAIPTRAALYMCKVTDGSGTSVWSEPAQMKILSTELKITSQPENFAGTVGDTASFTVVAEGEGVGYRWYLSSDGGASWSECWFDGYNTNTLSFYVNASRAANLYRCVVTDVAGNEITSSTVTVVTE